MYFQIRAYSGFRRTFLGTEAHLGVYKNRETSRFDPLEEGNIDLNHPKTH